jgi:hypothetical protein
MKKRNNIVHIHWNGKLITLRVIHYPSQHTTGKGILLFHDHPDAKVGSVISFHK